MPTFQYTALDSQGVEVKDNIEALSEKEAISKIRNMGYFPTKVRSRGVGKQKAAKAAAKYCDVVGYNRYYYTIENFYMPNGQEIDTIKFDKPILFGEWHVGALDRGMLHPSLRQTKDQNQRAQAYKDYVLGAMRNPNAVGTIYFQYQDQETTGRVGDGENYQIGPE